MPVDSCASWLRFWCSSKNIDFWYHAANSLRETEPSAFSSSSSRAFCASSMFTSRPVIRSSSDVTSESSMDLEWSESISSKILYMSSSMRFSLEQYQSQNCGK